MDDANAECWLPVVGYAGFYEVSDRGLVRSVRRRTASGWRGGRILKPQPHPKSGHLSVSLSVENVIKRVPVHQLVARAFLGDRLPGTEVRHLDGNPENNAVGNLMYGTRSENNLDAVRHGTHHNARKTRCKRGHEFTPANTVLLSGGRRRNCLKCKRRRAQEVAERKRLRIKAA